MSDIMKLAELCRNKNVYIQTHNFPDPDATALLYGLKMDTLQFTRGVTPLDIQMRWAGLLQARFWPPMPSMYWTRF